MCANFSIQPPYNILVVGVVFMYEICQFYFDQHAVRHRLDQRYFKLLNETLNLDWLQLHNKTINELHHCVVNN